MAGVSQGKPGGVRAKKLTGDVKKGREELKGVGKTAVTAAASTRKVKVEEEEED